MVDYLFASLEVLDENFWYFLGAPLLFFFGLYLTYTSRFFQVRALPQITKLFYRLMLKKNKQKRGIPALDAFFAAVGGCIGIGNVVGVAAAVQIGGPGAIFWMWFAALVGMAVKYAEIFLSVKHRVTNDQNSYNGGPMLYLQRVSTSKLPATLFAICLCLYGVEIYIFRVVTHSIVSTWCVNEYLVIALLLGCIIGAGSGGVRQVGKISSIMIPVFLILYSGMGLWILIANAHLLPDIFSTIFHSAFSGHAAFGSFVGSSLSRTITIGVQRACYTGDLGVGYAGTIHSETEETVPAKQASLGIFEIVIDTFLICTFSVLLIMVTDVWHLGIHEGHVVAHALSLYIPHIELFWPVFIFLLGYSSIIAFFSAGRKAARFLSPRYGERLYYVYAVCAFIVFSFVGKEMHMMMIMSTIQIPLMALNIYGMFKLRKEITFPSKCVLEEPAH